MIDSIDVGVCYSKKYTPRWGWHDDHRVRDGSPDYLPALQQVRAEFEELLGVVYPLRFGRALQLGLGECRASHDALEMFFGQGVATIDFGAMIGPGGVEAPGANTHSTEAVAFARRFAPYNFLFIDAGHSFDDVQEDHEVYGPLVSPGGIIAFHDALQRAAYPELGVWRYVEKIGAKIIGSEVGIAWIVK